MQPRPKRLSLRCWTRKRRSYASWTTCERGEADKIESAGRELLSARDEQATCAAPPALALRRHHSPAIRGPQTHLNEWVSISVRDTPCFVGISRGCLQLRRQAPLRPVPERRPWPKTGWQGRYDHWI